jgi:hypothetical protein
MEATKNKEVCGMAAQKRGPKPKPEDEKANKDMHFKVTRAEKEAIEKEKEKYNSLRHLIVDRCLPAAVKKRLKKK